jgi:hypothetical protein
LRDSDPNYLTWIRSLNLVCRTMVLIVRNIKAECGENNDQPITALVARGAAAGTRPNSPLTSSSASGKSSELTVGLAACTGHLQ